VVLGAWVNWISTDSQEAPIRHPCAEIIIAAESVGFMAIGLVRFQLTPALSVATGGLVGGNRRERLESGDDTMMIVQSDRH